MKLIKLNSITPGTRHTVKIAKYLLLKNNFLFKGLIKYKHKFSGRSSVTGRITTRGRGSSCKKKYRHLNFFNENTTSVVIAVCYDPNRTSFIALNFDLNKKVFFTTIASEFLFSGFIYNCSKKTNMLKLGYRTNVNLIPAGSVVNNLSFAKKAYSKYSRAAGTSCQVVQKTNFLSKIRLPSGKIMDVLNNSFATLGNNSNVQNKLICIGKAGKNRLKGWRSKVRGIAMNPVDHPHGGRTNSGFVYVTPWGLPTKGKKTKKK